MSSTRETGEQTVHPSSGNGIREKPDGEIPTNKSKPGETDASTTENATDRSLTSSRRTFLRGSALVVGSAVFSGHVSATEHSGPVQEIDSCTEITEPGEYVLTRDLEASGGVCLVISADDVLLDGAGHTISSSTAADGISVGDYSGPSFSNVTIQNFTIAGFTGTGIYHGGTAGGQVRDVTVEQSGNGLWFDQSNNVEIRDNEISNNGRGIVLTENGFENVLRSNTVTNNGGNGISLFEESAKTQIVGNTVTHNGRTGIVVSEGSDDCLLAGNLSKNNGGHGIDVSEVANVRLRDNLAESNGEHGIVLLLADGNSLIGNEVRENAEAGIEFASSSGAVHANTIANNQNGIVVSSLGLSGDPSTPEITNNNIELNSEFGVRNMLDQTVVATCNYWGDETGPIHEDNPETDPKGDRVSDNVEFIPWSVTRIRDGGGTCIGGTELPPVGDFENSPTDPDGDWRFEDVNGDGEFDIVDVQALFANRDDSTVQGNPGSFDFNDDSTFDVVDVQALFNKFVTGS